MGTEPVKKCPLFVMATIISFFLPADRAIGDSVDDCILNKCEWYDRGADKCSVWSIQKEIEVVGNNVLNSQNK